MIAFNEKNFIFHLKYNKNSTIVIFDFNMGNIKLNIFQRSLKILPGMLKKA